MFDGISPDLLNLTGPAAMSLIAVLVITRRLVWHSDLARERERGDRWEATALRALGVAEKTTGHAEKVVEAITSGAVSEVQGMDNT